ncbi:MAG: hypothetical protein M1834_002469 [Cirrosporium novae-zelandiae]|nr:MAG: hypothetical protein M1834_002469 [Cirrosporium novae-zelandiae]
MPFKVAIVGGGICGLYTALSIHQHCSNEDIVINVYEQAPHYKEIGAGVGLGVNAAKLFHRMGLGNDLNAITGDRNGVWMAFRRYDNGHEIVSLPTDDSLKVRQGSVHRAELLELLCQTIKNRDAATLHTNKTFIKVTECESSMMIHFRDGLTESADLVVGCDGIHSKVRSQFISDHPTYSGEIAWRGLVNMENLKTWWPYQTYAGSWLAKGRHFVHHPISQNKFLSVAAFVIKKECEIGDLDESWTSIGTKVELEDDFQGFDLTIQRIISHMPTTPSRWKILDREPQEQWVFGDGKIVLAGDAAHAMLPHQAQGAGQSIEDGYILGRIMQDYFRSGGSSIKGNLARWLNLYESVRLPRAQKAQQTSREAGDIFEMRTDDMKDRSYDECIPEVAERIRHRMKWLWFEDIDTAYEKARSSEHEAGEQRN